MNSPLQLERHFLTSVQIDADLTAKELSTAEVLVTSLVSIANHNSDQRRFKVSLKVAFAGAGSANTAYRGHVEFVGLFAVAEAYPQDKVLVLVETNGPSVLYGAAREMVANLTARGPWPLLHLPTQSFYKSSEKAPAKPVMAKSVSDS